MAYIKLDIKTDGMSIYCSTRIDKCITKCYLKMQNLPSAIERTLPLQNLQFCYKMKY